MDKLEGIAPELVFYYFERISEIPRGSGNTAAIRDYIEAFAKEHEFSYYADKAGNIVVSKPGSEGYEESKPIILQGHMDMVCVKVSGSDHDFTKDPIELIHDDEYIWANGTTLGGDDGIAVAYMLAILDDPDLKHPPLECLFTTDEEIGLLGAAAFDCSGLKGRTMLNLDSEAEGIFTCGCAGGIKVNTILPIRRSVIRGLPVNVKLTGLLGGHSGEMIDQGRANADKLMGRFLYGLSHEMAFSLELVRGGDKDNAIPSEAKAHIVIDDDDFAAAEKYAAKFERNLCHEFRGSDEGISIKLEKGNVHKIQVLDPDSQDRVIFFLLHAPYGVRKMSAEIEGLVETSSNLGIARTGDKEFAAVTSVRSSVVSGRDAIVEELRSLSEYLEGSISTSGAYPAWEYNEESPLRDKMIELYEKLYGEEPIVNVIHAGLECGLFYQKIKGLDAVSIGPDMHDIHTYNESLSIASVQRVWEFLVALLEELK